MSNHTTITLDPGERFFYDGGNLVENILFDCRADDCALRISPSGDDWTMRNVGVKGSFDRGSGENSYKDPGDGYGELLGNDEANTSSNTITIESCYFGDGCDPGIDKSLMTSSGSHAGHMIIRDTYVAKWNTSALYIAGSARSDESGGTYDVLDCYLHDNNIAQVRIAADGSSVQRCVMHNTNQVPWATFFGPLDDGIDATQINARGVWSSYGSEDQVVDVIDCEIDHTYEDACPPEYGWPSDSEQQDCYTSSVRGSGGDSSFDIQGGNVVPDPVGNIVGDTSGNNPDLTPPPSVPMTAEEAAGGEVIPTDTLTVLSDTGDTYEYELLFEGEYADTGPSANTNSDDPMRDSVTDNGDGTYTIHGYVANLTDDFYVHEDGTFLDITADENVSFEFNGNAVTRAELLDANPPTVPQNITRTPNVESIDVSWDPPSSGDVAGYRVYIDSTLAAELDASTTSHTLTGLEPSTTYGVGVSAFGPTGIESDIVSDTVTTQEADFVTQPLNLHTTSVDAFTISLAWDVPESTGPGVDFYTVYVDGARAGTATERTFTVEDLEPETEYTIEVTATDTEGTESEPATLTASTNDDGIVTAPQNLDAFRIESSRVDVSWDPPEQTGQGGIDHYTVFLNGTEKDTVGPDNRSYTFLGLQSSTQYTVDVTATDTGGHVSPAATTSVTTQGTEEVAPDAPRNLEATSITGSSVTVSFDPPSSVGTSPLSEYRVYVDGEQDHTLDDADTEFSVHGLSIETTYTFTLTAVNDQGLESDPAAITLTTTDGSVGGTPIDPDDPGCGFGNLQ